MESSSGHPVTPMKQFLLAIPAIAALASCQTTSPQPDRFALVDADRDNVLTRDEAIHYAVSSMFDALDANGDQVVTLAESAPDGDPDLVASFKARDVNNDGKVTLEEALAHARKAGTYDSFFAEADTDKNGVVSRAEAQAYTASKEGPVR